MNFLEIVNNTLWATGLVMWAVLGLWGLAELFIWVQDRIIRALGLQKEFLATYVELLRKRRAASNEEDNSPAH